MAADKNKSDGIFSLSQNFLSILVFGIFLAVVFYNTTNDSALSILLGIIAGVAIALISSTSKTGPGPQSVASSDGIDAGLKFWLFFLVGFTFLGYSADRGVLLGGIGGFAGGWIYAWWGSKEETNSQLLITEENLDNPEEELANNRGKRRRRRKVARRYRRRSGSINLKFWER
ncbi:MAG: hypothetical protein AAF208_08005 [Cyanobacteria bacterium P01_A01_bin.45]